MIPLHDDNPTVIRPWVTIGIIALCLLVFLWEMSFSELELVRVFYSFGFIPAVLLEKAPLPEELMVISPAISIFTSMFLHGGFFHLAGNMLYLWIFGNNVEDAMGHIRFTAFYLCCGAGAALVQAYNDPLSMVPMVGASGAIGGVLGAYLLLYPRVRVLVVIPLIFWTTRIPAYLVLGLWFFYQLLLSGSEKSGGIATWAHVGGFVSGMVLLFVFKRRDSDISRSS